MGGPQSQYGWVQKISPPPGFNPQTAQPVQSQGEDKEDQKFFQNGETNIISLKNII
jgi:hypothetical protein